MTTTKSNTTKNMTPAEAANLLTKLDEGNQAAWLSTRELSWQDPEYEARFQNAAEVGSVFRDIMQETIESGMRRPGEPVEEFAEWAGSKAGLAHARKADSETTANPIIQANAGTASELARLRAENKKLKARNERLAGELGKTRTALGQIICLRRTGLVPARLLSGLVFATGRSSHAGGPRRRSRSQRCSREHQRPLVLPRLTVAGLLTAVTGCCGRQDAGACCAPWRRRAGERRACWPRSRRCP